MADSYRAFALVLLSLAVVLLTFTLISPIAQDPVYHRFADARTIISIPNFLNVVSNLPFLIVGIWGLWYLHRHSDMACEHGPRAAYAAFFAGVSLTAVGSSYYHLAPTNDSLAWDRLPLTIAIAGLFSIIVGTCVSMRVANRLLIPLAACGIASVVYWVVTESRDIGDLRPYAIVQFLLLFLMPVIMLLYRKPGNDVTRYYWIMLMFYLLAKVFEYFDAAIFAAGQIVSGHTLKHLFASLTAATLLYTLMMQHELEQQSASG